LDWFVFVSSSSLPLAHNTDFCLAPYLPSSAFTTTASLPVLLRSSPSFSSALRDLSNLFFSTLSVLSPFCLAFNSGCTVFDYDPTSYGTGFNNAGGGVFALLFAETGISIWRCAFPFPPPFIEMFADAFLTSPTAGSARRSPLTLRGRLLGGRPGALPSLPGMERRATSVLTSSGST
jgi:hypothetical protein